tara:strand:+ start:906 stop:1337 length:432 start_codon:yes stop_codon:yes gene_type:complete
MSGISILTQGVRRFGTAFVSKRLQKNIDKTAEAKHPERSASLTAIEKKQSDRKALNKWSRKQYNTSGKYRATHIPPPALGVEPDHLMYMFRKGMKDPNPIFREMSKKFGKRYFDFKQAGREKGKTKQRDIDEAREKLRLSGDV